MKKIIKIWSALLVFGIPALAFAQNNGKTLRDIAVTVTGYLQVAIVLTISFAIVTFVWNVYRYFFTKDVSGENKKEAGLYVLYSVVGFFVILSFWGLVAVLRNSFKLPDSQPSWPFNIGGSSSGGTTGGSGFQFNQSSNGGTGGGTPFNSSTNDTTGGGSHFNGSLSL
jgi:hypothetical protein